MVHGPCSSNRFTPPLSGRPASMAPIPGAAEALAPGYETTPLSGRPEGNGSTSGSEEITTTAFARCRHDRQIRRRTSFLSGREANDPLGDPFEACNHVKPRQKDRWLLE